MLGLPLTLGVTLGRTSLSLTRFWGWWVDENAGSWGRQLSLGHMSFLCPRQGLRCWQSPCRTRPPQRGGLQASKRVGGRKKAGLKFHQALTEPAPWSPCAFVPFNQYVIKLKSQLKNFQRC